MPLVAIGDEDITVSTSAIGPTAGEVTNEVRMASFHLVSGGSIFHRMTGTPDKDRGNGEIGQIADDHWDVWGHNNIKNFLMVKRDGEADALIGVQYFGTGKT